MLTNSKVFTGLAVHARDGALGTVDQLYFDDQTWAIRYLTIETGNWLEGREVLVSPFSIRGINWDKRQLDVALSSKQIEESPDIDTHRPVSRQHEINYLDYYGYPYYWGGPYLWGPEQYPTHVPIPVSCGSKDAANAIKPESEDSHLRSCDAVIGYHIDAPDGEIGHVDGFVVDEEAWAIRYVEVATQNWWPGKKVLISPSWIERVSWIDSKVYVGLYREVIKNGPQYFESAPISRDYEDRLHQHYGQPPYWLNDSKHQSSHLLTSV